MPNLSNTVVLTLCLLFPTRLLDGQNGRGTTYRVDVDLVGLTFTVTDGKGNTVRGLRPEDVRIFEDGAEQTLASFTEGSRPFLHALGGKAEQTEASVFILFDTSNRMYTTFPYVYDAIAEFVRRLDPAEAVAIYTFSRNLSRAAPLTKDRNQARAGLTNAVAGDDTALFNSLLLTLRDAAKIPGRKAVVVFSNGPDNTSMVTPDDVGRVAENEGIPVYLISTLDAAKDRRLANALESLAARTGGRVYWAANWQKQTRAFESAREDIEGSYTAYYYPTPNVNDGFRNIHIEITAPGGKQFKVRARSGYQTQKRPQTTN